MPKGLPSLVKNHLAKARDSAISAVEIYNKPAVVFRSGNYVVLMIIAFTSLFHAVFYRRKQKPWYRKRGTETRKRPRYEVIDGDPAHWDLAECVRNYYGFDHPPEMENLRFIIGLRNKIEHRSMPRLDPALFGECQALLMNFEDLLVREFGEKYALHESLAMALQFSRQSPKAQQDAQKRLASKSTANVLNYIESFRTALSLDTLSDQRFRFSVYLVPKPANHQKSADFAIEFVHFDSTKPDEMEQLSKLTSLIKEKQVPVANLNHVQAGKVIKEVARGLPFAFNQHHHTACWKHFAVRPSKGKGNPAKTDPSYCIYDKAHDDYLYTPAWTKHLVNELASAETFQAITGFQPKVKIQGQQGPQSPFDGSSVVTAA